MPGSKTRAYALPSEGKAKSLQKRASKGIAEQSSTNDERKPYNLETDHATGNTHKNSNSVVVESSQDFRAHPCATPKEKVMPADGSGAITSGVEISVDAAPSYEARPTEHGSASVEALRQRMVDAFYFFDAAQTAWDVASPAEPTAEQNEAYHRTMDAHIATIDALVEFKPSTPAELVAKAEALVCPEATELPASDEEDFVSLCEDIVRVLGAVDQAPISAQNEELVALGARHAELDERSLKLVDEPGSTADNASSKALAATHREMKLILDRSLQLRATSLQGLRAKALIAFPYQPCEGTEEYDERGWVVARSLITDAISAA